MDRDCPVLGLDGCDDGQDKQARHGKRLPFPFGSRPTRTERIVTSTLQLEGFELHDSDIEAFYYLNGSVRMIYLG